MVRSDRLTHFECNLDSKHFNLELLAPHKLMLKDQCGHLQSAD